MSALSPPNGKYRRSWLTWGRQAIPSKQYCDNYDKINWESSTTKLEKEELSSPHHYKISVKSSGQ